jgi:colicin import membrane protein
VSNGIIEDEVTTIPGNGEVIPPESAAKDLFVPNGLDKIIARVRQEVDQFQPDISTEKGRKAIASLAHWVSKQKSKVEEYGKNMSMAIKRQATDIDAERKRGKEAFDALRDQARKPLDDYEAALAARLEGHEQALREVSDLSNPPFGADVAEIERRIAKLDEFALRNWEEFSDRFGMANDATSMRLNRLLAETKAQEEQRIAFAKLQEEQSERESAAAKERQEREQAERDERIAREATERAERASQEREAQAQREREAAATKEAENLARAIREKDAAVEAERQRAERVRLAEEAATKAREENKAHKAKIDKAIILALSGFDIPTEKARLIAAALSEGKIPNVKVNY